MARRKQQTGKGLLPPTQSEEETGVTNYPLPSVPPRTHEPFKPAIRDGETRDEAIERMGASIREHALDMKAREEKRLKDRQDEVKRKLAELEGNVDG